MCLDSEIDQNQLRYCSIFGVSIGYSENKIETLVNEAVAMIDQGKEEAELLNHIQSFH
jgi:hypothetical protein